MVAETAVATMALSSTWETTVTTAVVADAGGLSSSFCSAVAATKAKQIPDQPLVTKIRDCECSPLFYYQFDSDFSPTQFRSYS